MFQTRNHNRPNWPVITALQGFPQGLCDNCLQAVVGKTLEDAMTPAQRLRQWNKASYDNGSCQRCRKQRRLTRLLRTAGEQTSSWSVEKKIGLREFDQLWQTVVVYLDRLDGGKSKADFAFRIGQLREARRISPPFASLLLTYQTYRHAIRYDSFEPCEEEDKIMRHVGAYIDLQLRPISELTVGSIL